jgi:hypothetical protein
MSAVGRGHLECDQSPVRLVPYTPLEVRLDGEREMLESCAWLLISRFCSYKVKYVHLPFSPCQPIDLRNEPARLGRSASTIHDGSTIRGLATDHSERLRRTFAEMNTT